MVSSAAMLVLAASPVQAGDSPAGSPWQFSLAMGGRTTGLPTFDVPVGDTYVVGYPGLITKKFSPTLLGGEGNAVYSRKNGWDIEMGGAYWSGSEDAAARPVYEHAYGLAVTGLDGVSGVLVGATALEGDSVRASVDASLLEAHLRLAKSIDAAGIVVRPYAGVIFNRSSQDFAASFRLSEPQINNLEIPYRLSQEVDSDRIGGEVGVKLTVPLGQNLQFHAGAALALFHQATSMKADDCVANGQFSPGFDCEDAATPNHRRLLGSSANEKDDHTASRVKLAGGLSYLTPLGMLGMSVFAQYDSAAAGVKNPLMTQDQFLGGDPTRPPPAHLVFEDAWSYGGKVSLTVPLR